VYMLEPLQFPSRQYVTCYKRSHDLVIYES